VKSTDTLVVAPSTAQLIADVARPPALPAWFHPEVDGKAVV